LSSPSLNEIIAAHERFWNWIFSVDDGANHPWKISGGGTAQIQVGRMLLVAGSLPRDAPKNRTLQLNPDSIDYIFVSADDCICTTADGDGQSDQELINKAKIDNKGIVSVNGNNQTLYRLPEHTFQLNIQKCIAGTGRTRNGEGCGMGGPPGRTRAASGGFYAIIRSNMLKTGDIIRIVGIGGSDVTYSVNIVR
jgi:hypothetical protein